MRKRLATAGLMVTLLGMVSFPSVAQVKEGRIVLPDELDFDIIEGFPTCIHAKEMHGDKKTGPVFNIVEFKYGCLIPKHRHVADEQIVLMIGRAEMTVGDVRRVITPGAYNFIPAKTPHRLHCIAVTCRVFSTRLGPYDSEFVDRTGKAVSLASATAEAQAEDAERERKGTFKW